jgi:phenylpyruvate tautomerase PptA (4-oxalocrotonate tautomerase family)
MPITLTVSEGALTPEAEQRAFAGLTDALLRAAELKGNAFMEPNVVGSINVLPRGHILSGGKPVAAAFIELKLPGVALATPEAKRAFTEEATAVVVAAAEGRLERRHVWTNIVYAAEGSWGIDGQAYDHPSLGAAIQAAA